MEIKEYLNKLLDYGIKNALFEVKKIKEIPETCCKLSELEVIDFDKTKNIYCNTNNLSELKSADCLKFTENTIDFIEMKGFKDYLEKEYTNEPNELEMKISKFNFTGKIIDSIFILRNIILNKKFNINDKNKLFLKIPKLFIVVVDIDLDENPLEFISETFEFLAENSSDINKTVKAVINNDLSKITDVFYNLQQPILLSCSDLDKYYKFMTKMSF